jgi:uncharacterized protein
LVEARIGADAAAGMVDTWLLLGRKAGDNNQVIAVAEELNWPYTEKKIVYRWCETIANLLLRVTASGVDRKRSSSIVPPWPALVITSGRRNEPIARWIKRASGGVTRIVHIGRPWASPSAFDLVITTAQYDVPALPNVLLVELPLHRLSAVALAAATARWRAAFAHLPRPRTVVLLGGNSGAYTFDIGKARRLGEQVNAMVRRQGGSVLVSDSARTPCGVLDAVVDALDVPVYRYSRADKAGENPYLGYLAEGDHFVVTADSVSMMTEACYTGKPVYLFSLDDGPGWWRRGCNYRFDALVHRAAMTWGPRRMRRDVGRIVQRLRESGRAVWLGEEYAAGTAASSPNDDLRRAAQAVAALLSNNRKAPTAG